MKVTTALQIVFYSLKLLVCSALANSPQRQKQCSLTENPRRDGEHGRRHFLQKSAATSAASIVLPATTVATMSFQKPALAVQTSGEAIRRSAANLPGYGQADIFYPSFFKGKWIVEREVLAPSSDDLLMKQLSSLSPDPVNVSYNIRFITVDGNDGRNGGDFVVSDRQYNEVSFYNAVRDRIIQEKGSSVEQGIPSIRTSTWSASNPNVYTAFYENGGSKEIKVTKRATDIDEQNGAVSSSEFRRVTTIASGEFGGRGGIPSISASRVLTKWRKGDVDDVLEAIEVVYSEMSMGDPMMAGAGSSKPQLSSKSRLRLKRIQEE